MDKQQIKGRIEEAKGTVKEEMGAAVGKRNLLRKGAVERGIGRIQSKDGVLESDIENDVEDDNDDLK